jgi:hypothetical protein
MKRKAYFAMMKRLYEKMGRDDGYVPGWTTHTEVLLYEETGDTRYVDLLAGDMREQLGRYKTDGIVEKGLKRTGFKIPHRVAASASVLLHHESFSEEDKETLRTFIGELLSHAEYERGAMNRAFGFMAALNPLRGFFGPHQEDDDFDEVERRLANDWKQNCEPEERSYGYEALTYLYLIDWIESGGHQEWYHLPGMKRGFENMLYSRAGNGRCAVFGDWRPWEPCWGLYAAIFEKAAAVYQDGRFKFIAERLIGAWESELATDVLQHPHDLMGLSFACRWCDDTVPTQIPAASPAIITRNSGAPERLVLRSGWDEDDLFAIISLSGGEGHAHNDPLAINGLQAGGILLEDNGRETFQDYCHNVFLACDDPEDFLKPRYREKPGVWQTLRLDLRSKSHYGFFNHDNSIPVNRKHQMRKDKILPAEFDYDPSKEWVFMMRWLGIGSYTLRLKEVRLVSDTASKVLTDFQSVCNGEGAGRGAGRGAGKGDAWKGLSAVEGKVGRFDFDFASMIDKVPDDLGKLPPIFIGRRFPYPLDLENGEYDALEIDLMLEGNLPEEDFHFICIGGSEGYPRHWNSFALPQNKTEVIHYLETDELCHAVCQTTGNSRTRRRFEQSREVLFLRKRLLWIRDRVQYEDEKPFTAGPLWHVRKVLSRGENWVVAEAESKLLIYFLPKPGAVCDVAEWEDTDVRLQSARFNRYTFFQRSTTESQKDDCFDTLLIPLQEDEEPESIISSIHITHDADGGAIAIEIESERLVLDPIDPDSENKAG